MSSQYDYEVDILTCHWGQTHMWEYTDQQILKGKGSVMAINSKLVKIKSKYDKYILQNKSVMERM